MILKMKNKINKILVDVREPQKIFNILKREGIEYERVMLKVGDFVCEEKSICIERKTMADFAMSLIDGRIKKQIEGMKRKYKNNYFLISGRLSEIYWKGLSVPIKVRTRQVLGMMSSIVARHKIPILCVDNDTQLIYVVSKIIEKTEPKAL